MANLTFGFWVSRFDNEPVWRRHLRRALPGIAARTGPWSQPDPFATGPALDQRQRMWEALQRLRIIRNHAAHGRVVIDKHRGRFSHDLRTVAAAISSGLLGAVEALPELPRSEPFSLASKRHDSSFRLYDLTREDHAADMASYLAERAARRSTAV